MSLKTNVSLEPVPKGLIKANVVMLVVNLLGVAFYLFFVALIVWRPPGERADDIAGEGVVWFLFVAQVFGFYLILNFIWAGFIIAYRYPKGRRFWLLSALIWIIAVISAFCSERVGDSSS